MKNLLLFGFIFLQGFVSLNAQDQKTTAPAAPGINDQEVRKITETLTAKYSLDADQAKQMYTIQARKARNMAQIAAFQDSNPALYRSKVSNIQTGTLANIRRILHTKEQVALYQKTQAELRTLRNQKQKEMVAKKASKEAIETALLELYAE